MMLTSDLSGFGQRVSQGAEGFFCMMLTMELSGFSTVCKSGTRRPFLHDADHGIIWVSNRL